MKCKLKHAKSMRWLGRILYLLVLFKFPIGFIHKSLAHAHIGHHILAAIVYLILHG
jgi:hypothetical protein